MPRYSEELAVSLRKDYKEIVMVMNWLKRRKPKVTQVLELSVPDRLFCPHSDNDVRDCVNDWGVRVLKWRKLDLYLCNLDKDDLEELHLYSSGNPSVHDQWCAQLPAFKKVSHSTTKG